MQRDYRAFLEDIVTAIVKIEKYTEDKNFEDFREDELVIDGVVRNLEIIGKAVKKLPNEIRTKHSDIEWNKIAGIRDILIHAYFIADVEIVWDIVRNKLPNLKDRVSRILQNALGE